MDSNLSENLYRKKLIKSKSGLRIVLINQKYKSPFLLCEPYWVPDNEISHCTSCKGKFNFTKRKHHCRRCGRIYCSSCSCYRIPLPRMSFVDPVRVCNNCADITEQETEFFDKRIKTLTNGATFLLSPISSSSTTCLCICKLSADHQYLQFDSAANLPPLPLESITNFNVDLDLDRGSGFVEISYENGGFRLSIGPETTKTRALEWIKAIDEAFKLIDVSDKVQ
ncbi:zinc finger protein FYVE domain-containing protein, putative [Pediculus humanus corporis]|uniref:Zinc finger protein FYVE domain-containing protein, putative n=1 Tax=Pediculus humanus subsp. corporis TaxID=121224 RepID=E0VSW3_PEDHC|nr:zinc finger protein FYVE domain-containing protein, putative [Pediculus humanus corporis]EEB16469.1 zinc finger protein FYVE domain-containing protein, putative [Pediculus humanus corporis]